MVIVKSQFFSTSADVVKFININNIKREDILTITAHGNGGSNSSEYAIFFYADSDTKEITRGFFGW